MEFKMLPASAKDALSQIKERDYAQQYTQDTRKTLLIGISFDPEKQQIHEVSVEGA